MIKHHNVILRRQAIGDYVLSPLETKLKDIKDIRNRKHSNNGDRGIKRQMYRNREGKDRRKMKRETHEAMGTRLP